MGKFIDLTGQRFGRLLVLHYNGGIKYRAYWWCRCDCGTEDSIQGKLLRNGHTSSCGCLHREQLADRQRTHGHTVKEKASRTYESWAAMVQRCTNPTNPLYANYGAVGITVCDRWLKFENFLADVGERPPSMSLDRFPNIEGGYEPGNVRWATRTEQARNKTNNVNITHNGLTLTIAGWAERLGISQKTITTRLRLGWPADRVLVTGTSVHNNNRSRKLTAHGETLHVAEWARRLGIKAATIHMRLHRGASDEDALAPLRVTPQ